MTNRPKKTIGKDGHIYWTLNGKRIGKPVRIKKSINDEDFYRCVFWFSIGWILAIIFSNLF